MRLLTLDDLSVECPAMRGSFFSQTCLLSQSAPGEQQS